MPDCFVTSWTLARQAPLPCNFPGKATGVGHHFLLQDIFMTQGLNLHLLHWWADSSPLSHQGSTLYGNIPALKCACQPVRGQHLASVTGFICLAVCGSSSATSSLTVIIFCLCCYNGHPHRSEVISHCSFHLHFLDDE